MPKSKKTTKKTTRRAKKTETAPVEVERDFVEVYGADGVFQRRFSLEKDGPSYRVSADNFARMIAGSVV